MSDLYRRLAEKKNRQADTSPGPLNLQNPETSRSGDQSSGDGPSGEQISRGLLPEKVVLAGGWTSPGPQVWQRTLRAPVDPEFLENFPPGDPGIWCLDTETTGLSGGAGTRAFLAGGCRCSPDGKELEVVQYFLQDFDGEPLLVELLNRELVGSREIRTYNGGSFDLPLLKSRWILCGREFPPVIHRDLLPPSRRLWKPLLGKCSLKRVEEGVLGIFRQDDVPGEEVPGLYAAYLRKGAGEDFPQTLAGIFSHHVQDVVSLWYLDRMVQAFEADPLAEIWTPGTVSTPASSRSGEPPESWCTPKLLPPVVVNPRVILPHLEARQARELCRGLWKTTGQEVWGLALCRRLEAQDSLTLGDRMDVSSVLMTLWKEKGSQKALIRLLKFLEHREKTELAWKQALNLIQEVLRRPLPSGTRAELEKRQRRLELRLKKLGQTGS